MLAKSENKKRNAAAKSAALILSRYPTLIIAAIVIVGAAFQILPISVVRAGAIAALLAQVYQEQRMGDNQFMTSPLFLLGTIALTFFSLVLAVTSFPSYALHIKNVDSFFGSDAERVIVIFGLFSIAVHSLIARRVSQTAETNENGPTRAGKYVYTFAMIALIVSLAGTLNFLSFESGGPKFTEIRSISPPLLAFSLMFLVYQALEASRRQKVLIAVVIILSIASLVFIHEGKKPFFMIIVGVLYWLRLKKVSMKNIVLLGMILAPVFVGLVQIMQVQRAPHSSILGNAQYSPAEMFMMVISAKLVLRQEETRYCLQNVIAEHRQQPFSVTGQLFWLKGLVPRAIWPSKSNLSLGREYALRYCGMDGSGPHSASITLLGQPIIKGGGFGLLLHGGFLIACLGGMVWLGRKPRGLTTIAIAALLPWLIDFDQNFTLYTANAVKFFLVMLPLIILAAGMEKKYVSRLKFWT